jgi:hypothetical protein
MLLEMQTQLQSSNVAFLKPQTCCWKACISKHYVSNHILIVIKALFGLVSLSLPWSDSHASFHSGSSVCVGFGLFSLKSKSLFPCRNLSYISLWSQVPRRKRLKAFLFQERSLRSWSNGKKHMSHVLSIFTH